jgi:hypothetical protein
VHRDSVSSEEGAWPTGHRASPTRGHAVATVRRSWPHRSAHGAFKTATTRRGCLHSLSLPHSALTQRKLSRHCRPTPASSCALTTAPQPTKTHPLLHIITPSILHLAVGVNCAGVRQHRHLRHRPPQAFLAGAPPWRGRASPASPYLASLVCRVRLEPLMLTGPAIRAEQPSSSSEPACRGRGPPLPSLTTLAAAIALLDGTLRIVSRWGNMTVHLAAPKSATGGELRPPFLPSVLLSLACGPTLSAPRARGREPEQAARGSGPRRAKWATSVFRAGPASDRVYSFSLFCHSFC